MTMDNTITEDFAEDVLAAVNWNVEQAVEAVFAQQASQMGALAGGGGDMDAETKKAIEESIKAQAAKERGEALVSLIFCSLSYFPPKAYLLTFLMNFSNGLFLAYI